MLLQDIYIFGLREGSVFLAWGVAKTCARGRYSLRGGSVFFAREIGIILREKSVFFAREVGIPCPKGPYLTLPRSDASSQFGLFAFAGLRRASAVLEAGLYRIAPLPMSPRPCARGRYSAQKGWNTCARGRYLPGRLIPSDSFPRSGRVAPCHEAPYSCVRGRYSTRPARPTTTSRYDRYL